MNTRLLGNSKWELGKDKIDKDKIKRVKDILGIETANEVKELQEL